MGLTGRVCAWYFPTKGGKYHAQNIFYSRRSASRKLHDSSFGGYPDDVFGLKENQKTLLEDIALFFEGLLPDTEIETYETKEKNGGRQEVQICRKADAGWLKNGTIGRDSGASYRLSGSYKEESARHVRSIIIFQIPRQVPKNILRSSGNTGK